MEIISLAEHGARTAWHDRKRAGWLFLGIMLGQAFFVLISSLGAGYSELVRLPFARLKSDLLVQRPLQGKEQRADRIRAIRLPYSNQPISGDRIRAISGLAGVHRVSPAILLWFQEKKRFVTLAGIDPDRTAAGPGRVMTWITRGRPLQARGEIVVESHHARFNGLHVGDTVHFRDRWFTIVGVATIQEGGSLAGANFYLRMDEAGEMAGLAPHAANLLAISLAEGVDTETIREAITSLLPGALVTSTDTLGHMMRGFAGISNTASLLLSWTALGFTLLFSCWLVAGRLQEQRPRIGLMRTVGWRRRDILLRCGAETLAITLPACLAGIALGYLVARAIALSGVSLALPWNLAPVPTGVRHGAALQTMLVPLPVVLQPVRLILASAILCLAAAGTSLLMAARFAGQSIRQTLLA